MGISSFLSVMHRFFWFNDVPIRFFLLPECLSNRDGIGLNPMVDAGLSFKSVWKSLGVSIILVFSYKDRILSTPCRLSLIGEGLLPVVLQISGVGALMTFSSARRLL